MRLSKRAQYALLLVLYLSRAGRASISSVAYNLRIPKYYLEQIAAQLKASLVLKSRRGAHGGYTVVSDPTVGEVLRALGEFPSLLNSEEKSFYRNSSESEHRTLFSFVGSLSSAMDLALNRKVRKLGLELAANETAMMRRIPVNARPN